MMRNMLSLQAKSNSSNDGEYTVPTYNGYTSNDEEHTFPVNTSNICNVAEHAFPVDTINDFKTVARKSQQVFANLSCVSCMKETIWPIQSQRRKEKMLLKNNMVDKQRICSVGRL